MSIFSQSQKEVQQLHSLYDKSIGLNNTDLSYGKIYKEKYRTKTSHQYYKLDAFVLGNVNYQNHNFYDVYLKYDLADDQLICSIKHNKSSVAIVLEQDLVSSFTINTKQFKKTALGYLEELYSNANLTFLKKYKKEKKKKLNDSFLYYKFISKPIYYVKFNNNYFEINKRKDLLKALPNYSKLIKNFYRQNNTLKKKNLNMFYISLAKEINNKMNNK